MLHRGAMQQEIQQHHNYCNISPLLGDVINKKPEHFSTVQPNQVFTSLLSQNQNQNQNQIKNLYENTKQVLDKLEDHRNMQQQQQLQQQFADSCSNYLNMVPVNNQPTEVSLPVIPFDLVDFSSVDDQRLGYQEEPVDPISLRLRELHDALGKNQ
jgi:response regulator RpfG family c-di-GMP phosphodiesterase